MSFESPWFLVLLVLAPLLQWKRFGDAITSRIPFPTSTLMASIRPSLRRRLLPILRTLRMLAFSLVVLCLARPQSGLDQELVSARGIDIQLVLDISSSMTRTGLSAGRTRLEVAASVIDRFVLNRPEDRIGLVTFARFPRTVCPLTLDHDALRDFLSQVNSVGQNSEENTTAIGVALATAVLKLRQAEERTRIVILLTDGEEMEHDIEPLEAAELARAHGIKVYTVAVATRTGKWAGELRRLAELTGAQGWVATDARTLSGIYDRIDRLERRDIQEVVYTDWTDLYPVYLWVAVILLLLELPLDLLLMRRVP